MELDYLRCYNNSNSIYINPNGDYLNEEIDADLGYGINLYRNNTSKVEFTRTNNKYNDDTGCLQIKPGGCIYTTFPEIYGGSFEKFIEFTIDFWVYCDKGYIIFNPETDLEESDEYTQYTPNPYLFVYGLRERIDRIESDGNGYYYIPQVTAVGYNSKTQKLFVERIFTEIRQKQNGVQYHENTNFYNINGGEYYVAFNTMNGRYPSGKNVIELDMSTNEWHHISFSCGKDIPFSAHLKLDFGSTIAFGEEITYSSTTTYPPNIQGPISFGNYGQIFFNSSHAFMSIGNQAIPFEQDWIKWKMTQTGENKPFGNVYIDNLRIISGKYIDIIPNKHIAVIGDDAYGIINGNFQQLATNWSLLSADQRLSCYKILDSDAQFNIADIAQLVTDPNTEVRIETYCADYSRFKTKLRTDEDHKAIVEPKNLIDVSIYGEIEKITVDYEWQGKDEDGIFETKLKIAPTNDLVNGVYYKYNFSTYQWNPIAASEIATKGIDVDQLGAIPKQAWSLLGDKIAFGYYLEEADYLLDFDINIALNAIKADCNITNSQECVSDVSDVEYSYITPSKILIKFLTDGNYKISYYDKEVE